MAQDNTPAIVMYKGPQEDGYSIPFDKGYYGEVKVAFVRRGLTDYEYMPTTYTVDGALYAWEISTGVYYYTKSASPAVDATVYNSGNQEISGVKVVSTQDASASFSDGKTGIRSNKKDIHSHALLFWTGEPLGNDDWICIVRETVKKQPYSYPNNQKHIEGALDNLSRQIQELKAQSDVSLKVDPTFTQDPQKMNPIDWLNTIVRSTDTTARGLRYRNFWLEYSTDDPNKAESDKSWTKLLNTTNITSVREWYDEDNNVYIPQYSMDGGLTWKALGAIHLIEDVQEQIDELKENVYTKTQVDGKFSATNAAVDANADAIQKTREDYIQADSEIHQILNNHAENLTTLHNDVDDLGDQVAEIESKIPESASETNQLATKADLANIDLDGYVKKSGDTMTGDLEFDVVAGGYTITFQDSYANVDTGNTDSVIKRIQSNHSVQGLIFSETKNGTVDMQFTMIADGFFMPHGNRLLGSADYPWENIYAKKLNNGADVSIPTEGGTLARIEDLIDLRADINEADSELQTQITAQAAEIATKQDQLTAGDNIIISGNVISATGAGGGAGFDIVVVQELPATGQKGIIYLLAKDGAAPDVYDEYVWVTATQTFELIGTTAVDLSGYLPTTGGTLTGTLSFTYPGKTYSSDLFMDSTGVLRLNNKYEFALSKPIIPYSSDATLGTINAKWSKGYINALYTPTIKASLTAGNLTVPIDGGTLARLEDITDINNNSINTKDLTVGTDEGTINIGVVAGTATIATNNGLDIVAQTKFDTAPTTDDNTTWENALGVSLVRKAQVATVTNKLKSDQDVLYGHLLTLRDMLNVKDEEGEWVKLTTEAQEAIPAINELNAKIGEGGTKVIFREWE